MLSLGDGTMEVMEDSPPGHSIAHALPKTVKHPQWQQVALPTDPDRVSPETCCQLQIKRSHPSLSLAQSRYCLRRCCQCHRINPSRQQLRQHGERDVAGDSVMLRLREMNGRLQTPGSLFFFQVVATCRWTGRLLVVTRPQIGDYHGRQQRSRGISASLKPVLPALQIQQHATLPQFQDGTSNGSCPPACRLLQIGNNRAHCSFWSAAY
jgi:hypothetical protein